MSQQHRKLFSSVSILTFLFGIFVIGKVIGENVTDTNSDIWSSLLEQYTIE